MSAPLRLLPAALRADPRRIGVPEGWPQEESADRAPEWVAQGTPEPLREALVAALGEDRVLARALDLVRYASDASPYRKIPQAIVMAQSVEDVVRLLRLAHRRALPLVFRAGGTSLNGQAQSDSVLVEVRRHWQRVQIEEEGRVARVQPGAVLGYVNRRLARFGRRLGPDPASTDVACVGGVIANNSGGMRCGVVADAYRTVRSLKLVLANGAVIDTAAPGAEERFAAAAPELAAGLLEIRDELRADVELADRVRRKFQIKNTTGYRLCAFLEAESPLEIFRRLVIGSEGTLAFVAEACFETVALGREVALALIPFQDVDAAAEAVGPLVAAGATATELMVAPTLIAAAWNMPGTPEAWKDLPPQSAALLVELRGSSPEALARAEAEALALLEGSAVLEQSIRFSREREEIEMLWRVREGMQGLLAAMRGPGVSLIIEDVCVPPERLAEAVRDLQALLGEHGFLPGVAGHASAGNLHFLLTPDFSKAEDLERYDRFMHELVELIVEKYDGSLKAEHGTGLNMAPFVEREWGEKATEMMWRVKRLADPDGILAPGVLLNRDPEVHLRDLKSAPEIEAEVTKCIECGFCEPVCPSRNVTTTPRQRIVLRREMARQADGSPVQRALLEQYQHDGIDTCAVDGMCRYACPVAIDTGKLIKGFRAAEHPPRAAAVAVEVARRAGTVERAGRVALGAGGAVVRGVEAARARAAGRAGGLPGGAAGAARANGGGGGGGAGAPVLPRPGKGAGGLPATTREGAAAVYMPACINRIFAPGELSGTGAGGPSSVPELLVELSRRAGRPVWIPPDVLGHCCGTPWSSKGYPEGAALMRERTGEALRRWSEGGRLPVIIDASSCTHGLLSESAGDDLQGVEVLDSVSWVHDRLLPALEVRRPLGRVAVHPNCSAVHLGVNGKLVAIAEAVAAEVFVPAGTGCCGMAGDRGWIHPELPQSALRSVAEELAEVRCDAYLSSNRTCEAALEGVTGRPYGSFLAAVEEATREDGGPRAGEAPR